MWGISALKGDKSFDGCLQGRSTFLHDEFLADDGFDRFALTGVSAHLPIFVLFHTSSNWLLLVRRLPTFKIDIDYFLPCFLTASEIPGRM